MPQELVWKFLELLIDNLPNSQSIFAINGQINFRVPFYKSPSLGPGNHTLTITVPPEDTSSGLFYLDYIIYHPIPTSTISCPAATIVGGVIGSIMGVVVGHGAVIPVPSTGNPQVPGEIIHKKGHLN
ncbi:hypothetical protein C8R41DRAFT_868361 [Lentinula lateritia]|uniref:Uncharacterized protein n=1 Tax=Lentinula lateritia TaxID=40482 RepID=A0ABQ8VBN8_9AGAR|nr:hypothetical protein C8R41DRAFT_868361 [Lentinula lateritia]